jgi:hypothetical protein
LPSFLDVAVIAMNNMVNRTDNVRMKALDEVVKPRSWEFSDEELAWEAIVLGPAVLGTSKNKLLWMRMLDIGYDWVFVDIVDAKEQPSINMYVPEKLSGADIVELMGNKRTVQDEKMISTLYKSVKEITKAETPLITQDKTEDVKEEGQEMKIVIPEAEFEDETQEQVNDGKEEDTSDIFFSEVKEKLGKIKEKFQQKMNHIGSLISESKEEGKRKKKEALDPLKITIDDDFGPIQIIKPEVSSLEITSSEKCRDCDAISDKRLLILKNQHCFIFIFINL